MEATTYVDKAYLIEARHRIRGSEMFKNWGISPSIETLTRLVAKANIYCQQRKVDHPGKAINLALADSGTRKDSPEWKVCRAVMFEYYALRKKTKRPLSKTTPTKIQTISGWKEVEKKGQLPLI